MTKNSLYKRLCLTLIIVVALFIMVIPVVSAFEFDNIKSDTTITFDGKLIKDYPLFQIYKPIKITNAFGLGSTLFEGYIDTHTETCGIDCSSTIKIKTGQDGILIDDVIFKTLQEDGSWVEQDIRNYQFKYWGNISDYEYKCIDTEELNENGTKITECSNIQIGSHEGWINYNLGDELPKGEYEIKLEAQKKPSRTVDWIIKTNGEWLDSWATWGSIGGGDDAEVILHSPADDYESPTRAVEFNCSAEVQGGSTLNNISLWNNISGTWEERNTTLLAGIGDVIDTDFSQTGTVAVTSYQGIKFIANKDTTIGQVELQELTGAPTKLQIRDDSKAELKEVSFSGKNATLNYAVTGGLEYYLTTDSDGASFTRRDDSTPNYPILGDNINITTGVENGGNEIAILYMFKYIETLGWVVTTNQSWNDVIDGDILWNCEACDSDDDCGFATSNRTIFLDSSVAHISVSSPNGTTDYNAVGLNETLNVTFTDTNLDKCWYNYNGTNVTIEGCVSGINNITNFTLEDNNFNMTLYANDTAGNINSTPINWSYKLLQTAEHFVASTTSGATNPFNITLDSASQITIAYLNYNNTAVLGSISSNGSTYVLSRDQIAPGVSSATNISFFWNITRADGFNYATTAQNQTVSPIVINQTCTGMYSIFNFTLVDELTQVKINGAAENSSIKTDLTLYTSDGGTELSSFYHEYISTNPAAICLDNNLSNGEKYLLDLQVQYKTDNHSAELYHIEDYILNSSSLNQNITLYDLPTASTQKFQLLVRDTSYIPINGALIKIDRKYIENGTFYTTEIPKTDAKGVTSASLETDDVIYNFYIYDNSVLISTFTNVLAICQTPLVSTCSIDFNAFQTGISIPDFELGNDFNFTLGYNSTSKVVSSVFNIPSGEPATILLEVIREDTLGTAVCSDTLTSASGTLTCTVPASFGNSSVLAKIYKTGVEQGRGNVKLDQSSSDIFGPILIMLSVLVMLTLIGIGISDNPIVSAVFLFVGVLLLFAMNLVQSTGFYGAGATVLFLGIAIILVIVKAGRRT